MAGTHTWNNKGTRQSERFPVALSSDFVMIDERSFNDLIEEIAECAPQVKYFNDNNQANDDWKAFFKEIYDYDNHGVKTAELERQMQNGEVKPHLALMLSFLKLYQIQQENLNKLTERHLEFYYKDVLGFQPKKGQVGKVTVFFELNKNAEHAFAPKGTLFDAGKDTQGKRRTFAACNDISINNAKVKEVLIYNGSISKFVADKNNGVLITPNDQNALENSSKLGEKPFGIAFTSPSFNLPKEDNITFVMSTSIADFDVEYTGKEKWEKATISGNKFNVDANLVAPYDPTIHGECIESPYPVIRILTKNQEKIKGEIDITEIIVTNGTNFQIKNKFGLSLNQAGIYPFGTVAAIGDSFSIELPNNAFVKKDTTINLSWLNDKTKKSMEDNYAGEKADGKGEGNEDSSKYIFFHPEDVDVPTGGLKVSLKTDKYNQIKYAYNYSKQISDYIIKQGSTNIEEKPIIPELEAPISLNYSINIEKLQKHTISPFGTITEKVIPNAQEIPHKQITTPQQITKTLPTISEFAYILLENVHETDVLSLYFKLNPYCNFETHDAITYYNSKAWTQMQTKDIISDSTDGLRHSGILTIRVSKSMLETKLQQGEGMLWIRIPCKDNFLEAVFTQAAELEFNPQSEGMVENGETIPAETISKSLISIAGVKKIEQKFDGLPGNADESEIQFKSRVSERLRHKNRAVSEWDYERIVLEHFPEVEAARCLSCCDGNGKFAPGHITLLLFPYKNELNDTDQLQPKLSDKTLSDVEAYLKERMSPFVKLHVINPKYVSATVECDIKLANGCNDTTYYEELLNEALKQYLAPWYETNEPVQSNADKNQSNVVEFLNELEYVDNVDTTTIKIKVEDNYIKDGSVLQPQNPIKVLTSALKHTIKF